MLNECQSSDLFWPAIPGRLSMDRQSFSFGQHLVEQIEGLLEDILLLSRPRKASSKDFSYSNIEYPFHYTLNAVSNHIKFSFKSEIRSCLAPFIIITNR